MTCLVSLFQEVREKVQRSFEVARAWSPYLLGRVLRKRRKEKAQALEPLITTHLRSDANDGIVGASERWTREALLIMLQYEL